MNRCHRSAVKVVVGARVSVDLADEQSVYQTHVQYNVERLCSTGNYGGIRSTLDPLEIVLR